MCSRNTPGDIIDQQGPCSPSVITACHRPKHTGANRSYNAKIKLMALYL